MLVLTGRSHLPVTEVICLPGPRAITRYPRRQRIDVVSTRLLPRSGSGAGLTRRPSSSRPDGPDGNLPPRAEPRPGSGTCGTMTAVLRRLGGATTFHPSPRHRQAPPPEPPGAGSVEASPDQDGLPEGKASMPRTDDQSQLGRDYLWNTSSSLMTSLSTVVMLLVVTRVVGIEAAGVYSLALAVGQQFQTLGMYEVRTFHATDVRHRFSFGTYHATRIVTVLLMMLGIVAYAGWSGGGLATVVLVSLVAMLRVFDAYEDAFYSEFQRAGRLDLGARASFVRTLATTAVFSGAIVVTSSLLASTVLTLVVSLVVMVVVFVPPARRFFAVRPQWTPADIGRVLLDCLPLFLASFVAMYLANAPRFAIDHYLDAEHQGYFAILFMPAVTINLFSLMVFRPLLTRMALRWTESDWAGFMALVRRGLTTTLIAFATVSVVTYAVGVPLLALVFGKDVSGYRAELMVLVAGGALNSTGVILYYALTTVRLQKLVFLGYVIAAAAITVLSVVLVPSLDLMGAALAYAGATLTLTAVFAAGLTRGRRARDVAM